MNGIINIDEMKELKRKVKLLTNVDGMLNQIYHLYMPDDNEVFEYVFEYLGRSIDSITKMWKILKNEMLAFRGRDPDVDHIDISKVKQLFEARYGKLNTT